MARFGLGLFIAALMASGGTAPAAAPEKIEPINYLPSLSGDYFPLASVATGATYHIYIRHPQGYADQPTRRYPVVYLLDGDSLFPLLAAQHLFLTIDDKLPEAIVVGIAYGSFSPAINRRETDYGSGAAAFQKFLSTELMPRVEATARADPARRILVGQSFGGSFVLYSALTEPDLFWARIASNPSFRLHGPKLLEAGERASRPDLRLFVVSGTENAADARQKSIAWVDSWISRKPAWAVERIDVAGGTHAADIGNAYRAALRRLFDWSPSPSPDPH